MKFPIPRELLPSIKLSADDRRRIKAETSDIITKGLDQYHIYVNINNRKVDGDIWKNLLKTDNIVAYAPRAKTPKDIERKRRATSQFIAVGTLKGNLEDVVYGCMTHTPNAFRMRHEYFKDGVVDMEVLDQIILPTPNDPLHTLTLNWSVREPGNEIVSKFVPYRDFWSVNATGMTYLPNGERVVYHALHQPSFLFSRIPELTKATKLVRMTISLTTIYRQLSPGKLEFYRYGGGDLGGRVPSFIVKRTLTANAMHSTAWLAVEFARAKKLRWLMKSSNQPEVTGHPDFCRLCESRLPSGIRNTCRICRGQVCLTCRTMERVAFVSRTSGLAFTKKVCVCRECFQRADNLSAAAVAKDEAIALAPGRSNHVQPEWMHREDDRIVQGSGYASTESSSAKGSTSSYEAREMKIKYFSPPSTRTVTNSHQDHIMVIVSVVAALLALLAFGGPSWWDSESLTQSFSSERKRSGQRYSANAPAAPVRKSSLRGSSVSRPVNEAIGRQFSDTKSTNRPTVWNDEILLQNRVDARAIERIVILGKGASGEVWLSRYMSDTVVVKQLREDKKDAKTINKFVAEVKLMARLNHPKICPFLGVAWTRESDIVMLMEYMSGGDLRDYLDRTAKLDKRWTIEKLSIAIDIAEALTHLHNLDPKILHRDLKAKNVLLDEQLNAKLADFGISRQIENETLTSAIGTGRWMAPEILTGQSNYTEAVDIYSFGVVILELDSHAMPFSDHRLGSNENGPPESVVLGLLSTGKIRPAFSKSCPSIVKDLAIKCLSANPAHRPPALQIAFALRKLRFDLS